MDCWCFPIESRKKPCINMWTVPYKIYEKKMLSWQPFPIDREEIWGWETYAVKDIRLKVSTREM